MTPVHADRLIISYEATTPSVFSLRDATRGLCEIIWLIDFSEPGMANSARLLSRVGHVVDMADLSQEQTVDALRRLRPTGMVSLNDRRMTFLAEIADPKTVNPLMAVAGDPKQDAGVRCNAIHALGRMRAAAATELMRKLLADEKEAVQVQAAIALYRLTGETVKQFPAGYKAD